MDGPFRGKLLLTAVLFLGIAWTGCAGSDEPATDTLHKITFDMSQLDEDGLFGSPDGRRAIDYEFCIPARKFCVGEVTAIDSTVVVHGSSPGRIGCGKDEYLCIGNTHQENFRQVLQVLSTLDYIDRIDVCVYE